LVFSADCAIISYNNEDNTRITAESTTDKIEIFSLCLF
jgi:hypothetical protein